MKKLTLVSIAILLTTLSSLSARTGVGDELPSAQVTTLDNQTRDLKVLIGDSPTLLIFYRGGWCPYCNIHLADLNSVKEELTEAGFNIVALSTDLPAEMIKTLDDKDLSYTLISDAKMHAADAFGISYVIGDEMLAKYVDYGIDLEKASGENHHKLPHPAAYLIKDGVIQYAFVSEDYSVRVSGKDILAKAKEL